MTEEKRSYDNCDQLTGRDMFAKNWSFEKYSDNPNISSRASKNRENEIELAAWTF